MFKRRVLVILFITLAAMLLPLKEFAKKTEIAPKLSVVTRESLPILEKKVLELMDKGMIPGLSLAVIREGKLFWYHGFGVKSIKTGQPVSDDTIFEAASISKLVFAYAVYKLIEQGKLDLDTPLMNYVTGEYIEKEFLNGKIEDQRLRKITPRIVLCHSSGFPNWRRRKLEITFDPGTKYSYSGEGYVFLQRIVEKITGKELNEFMTEMVFKPLGMKNSSYIWQDKYEQKAASGHTIKEVTSISKPDRSIAAASLLTTARDLGILVTAILNEQGLKKETIALMLKPAIKTEKSDQVLWALGPGLVKTNCGNAFFQWGDNGDFKGLCIAFKKQKAGLVYLSNSSSGLSIAKDIVAQALGADISALFPGFFSDNYPAHDSVYMQLIHTYLKKGINPAIEKMKKFAAESGKKNSLCKEIHQFGQTILEQGDYQGAVEILKFAAEGSPESVPILMDLAKTYAGTDQFDLSLQIIKKARALNLKKKEVKEADINWTMDWVKAIKNPLKLSLDHLKKLEGDYSGRHIRLKEETLFYFRDNASSENYRKLYPLSEDTFILKEISWFRLRFSKDKKGNIKKITGIYQSGRTNDSLRDLPEKKEPNKGNAEIVYRLPLENFFPEGMAYDPVDKCFYLGSLSKYRIIRIDMNGKCRDFIAPGQDNHYSFAGMRVDQKRRVLWANVFSTSSKETGIFKYDLKTGQLLRKYLVPQKTENHIFNDVTVMADGSVYITGFEGGTVYHIDAKNGELSVFLELGKDSWTNGIDITPGEKYLLIASNDDILRVGLGTKEVKIIQPPQGEKLGYADGLYYYNGGILAVQGQRVNGKLTASIARTYLDKEYLQATKRLVLEADHPAFRLPTTGAIVNDEFYFIATSFLDKWKKKLPVVYPVLIMKVKIK